MNISITKELIKPSVRHLDASGELAGEGVVSATKTLGALVGVYGDSTAFGSMDPETVAYKVCAHMETSEGVEGGLFFGYSHLSPGKVGNEYFMTRGHFHSKRDRTEYYWGVAGIGALILMDEDRNCWAEKVFPGSVHYIKGHIAHRLANVGNETLIVGASWPSDAGHDYESIDENGFSARLVDVDGKATLVSLDDL